MNLPRSLRRKPLPAVQILRYVGTGEGAVASVIGFRPQYDHDTTRHGGTTA